MLSIVRNGSMQSCGRPRQNWSRRNRRKSQVFTSLTMDWLMNAGWVVLMQGSSKEHWWILGRWLGIQWLVGAVIMGSDVSWLREVIQVFLHVWWRLNSVLPIYSLHYELFCFTVLSELIIFVLVVLEATHIIGLYFIFGLLKIFLSILFVPMRVLCFCLEWLMCMVLAWTVIVLF